MTNDDLPYARESYRGITAECPKTHQLFLTSRPRFTTFNGHRAVWCPCRFCDAYGRTRGDEGFDPREPGQHPYLLDEVRYADDD